jgi:predicted MFS family arabinose efflux permease
MVVPFMSLYLTADLGFSLKHVGWAMSVFGLGSVVGAWIGGKLTDKFGFYPVIFWSLFISGIMFTGLQFLHSFTGFCIGVFLLMVVADMLRPAIYVALNSYSKPANRTRSVTLIRLAINLGFSMGPAAGGIIIGLSGYGTLFWVDGFTCIMAGIMFIFLLNRKRKGKVYQEPELNKNKMQDSPYKDKAYMLFILTVTIIGFAFLQYFSTIPLYYRDVHKLSEEYIGLLMAINGLLIFTVEMPLMKYFEKSKYSIYTPLFISTLLIAASFLILNFTRWNGILVIGMLMLTIGEMMNFPFLNRFALDRAEHRRSGDYMALFTMAFSLGHIFGHNSGMQLVNRYGFDVTWYVMAGSLFLAFLLLVRLKTITKASGN